MRAVRLDVRVANSDDVGGDIAYSGDVAKSHDSAYYYSDDVAYSGYVANSVDAVLVVM